MKIMHFDDVPTAQVDSGDASGVSIQWLVSVDDGAPNFAMRRFTVEPGGWTPHHSHPHEHEVFVLSGEGLLIFEDKKYPLRSGSFAFVDPNGRHQLRNTGDSDLVFLCVVPL